MSYPRFVIRFSAELGARGGRLASAAPARRPAQAPPSLERLPGRGHASCRHRGLVGAGRAHSGRPVGCSHPLLQGSWSCVLAPRRWPRSHPPPSAPRGTRPLACAVSSAWSRDAVFSCRCLSWIPRRTGAPSPCLPDLLPRLP